MKQTPTANSEILIYSAPDGAIKIDVQLENDTVWLTQADMARLFQTTQQNISQHLQTIYEENELSPEATYKKILLVRKEGNREVRREIEHYNLDTIIQMNGRELLTHAGKISHEKALEKSAQEYNKFRETQKQLEYEESLKELERDIKDLKKQSLPGK